MSNEWGLDADKPPSAPRAMRAAEEDMNDENVGVLELANLLYGIHPFQGLDRVDSESKRLGNRDPHKTCRHSFLDNISYLCDIHPEGGTVTAGALNRLPSSGVLLYLAANEGVPDHIRPFIEWVVTDLLKSVTSENCEEKKKTLLREAMKWGWERMDSYRRKTLHSLRNCRPKINEVFRGKRTPTYSVGNLYLTYPDGNVLSWIRKVENEKDRYGLSLLCYNARGKELDELKKQGKRLGNCDFAELAHYIGRLGAHAHAVSTIITAALKVPVLQSIMGIEYLPPSRTMEVELPKDSVDFHSVTKKICKEGLHGRNLPDSDEKLYVHLYKLYYRSGFALESNLEQRKPITTRVHAELQIVDYFSRKKLKFVDDDKYIGCSKPACYLCYKWIYFHPGGFSLPASHKKVILGWRAPDVDVNKDVNGNGARNRKDLCARLKKSMVQDIDEQVKPRSGDESYTTIPRHLSSNGSGRASSLIRL